MGILKRLQVKKEKEQGKARSGKWPTVRKAHLLKNPACAVCGAIKGKIEVHHLIPFHSRPELELDPKNLLTLCENDEFFNCHRLIGHLNNFKGWNPDAVMDAQEWVKKLAQNQKRIKPTK